MTARPPRSTSTHTLFPYTPLFRSQIATINQPVRTPPATQRVMDGQALPPAVASPSTGRRYMVDLGSGARAEMEQTFLTLKAQNSSLLGTAEPNFPDANSLRTGSALDSNSRPGDVRLRVGPYLDRKSTRLNSSH